MSDAVNSTISSAGSARKPTNISRRAPSEPNAVPMSIAASAMNTRASANRPTSAIASAARANGRSVASDGTIAAAQHIAPNTMYGVIRKIGEALFGDDRVLHEQLADRPVGQQQRRRALVLRATRGTG